MGVIDIQTDADAQAEYDQLLLQYQEANGALPENIMNALVYQAISENNLANLTGTPLERVSIQTRLKGLRLLL